MTKRNSSTEPYDLDTSTANTTAISKAWKSYKKQSKQLWHSESTEIERNRQKIM